MNNSVRRLLFSLSLATLLIGLILHFSRKKNSVETVPVPIGPPQVSQPPAPDEQPTAPSSATPLLADQLLSSYGKANGNLAEDIKLFKRYLSNVFILTKQRDPRHYATNEDLVLFLTGKKGNLTPYLSSNWSFLNEQGQIRDRFGSPLIIHPLSRDQIEIRSAGADQVPYTEDDVVQ